jgi:hypothetical protein
MILISGKVSPVVDGNRIKRVSVNCDCAADTRELKRVSVTVRR